MYYVLTLNVLLLQKNVEKGQNQFPCFFVYKIYPLLLSCDNCPAAKNVWWTKKNIQIIYKNIKNGKKNVQNLKKKTLLRQNHDSNSNT